MLTEIKITKEHIRSLIQEDVTVKYGTQFLVDSIIIMDERNETAVHDFEIHAQITIHQLDGMRQEIPIT